MSVLHERAAVEALSGLSGFRDGFYDCLDARADALFELADAAICTTARSPRWHSCRWQRCSAAGMVRFMTR